MPGKPPLAQRRSFQTALCGAALVVAGMAAYSSSFLGAFVFDDSGFLALVSRKHLPVGRILLGPRPVADLTFALNYALDGMDPDGYHLLNLAIHLLAALTLFGVVRRTLELPAAARRFSNGLAAAPAAFCIALLWMLHPLLTQSVTYIAQRTESLMGLFFLLTLYCLIRAADADRTDRTDRTDRSYWSYAAVAACALGMGSKQVMVAAPLLALLYDRSFLAGSFREALRRRWKLYLALAATWLILAGSVIQAFARHPVSAGFALSDVSPLLYAWNELAVIPHYLQLALWPGGLSLDYGWPIAERAAEVVPGALIVGILLAWTLWAIVFRPRWGFLGAWFFLILAPTSSFMPLKDLAFEQRMYLPLAAVVTLAVLAAGRLIERATARDVDSEAERRLTRITVAAVLTLGLAAALGCRTYLRNLDYRTYGQAQPYRTSVSIWLANVKTRPQNPRAWNNLGEAWFHVGHYDEAKQACGTALALKPDYADAYNNLGLVCAAMNALDEALDDYNEAVRLNPMLSGAYVNRGNLYDYRAQGARERNERDLARQFGASALKEYDLAIRANPDNGLIYINRALTYCRMKEYRKALADIEKYEDLGGAPPEDLLADIARGQGQSP